MVTLKNIGKVLGFIGAVGIAAASPSKSAQADVSERLNNHIAHAEDILSKPGKSSAGVTEAFNQLRGAFIVGYRDSGSDLGKMKSQYGNQFGKIMHVVTQFSDYMTRNSAQLCYGARIDLGEGNGLNIDGGFSRVLSTGIQPHDTEKKCYDFSVMKPVWDKYAPGKQLEIFHEMTNGLPKIQTNYDTDKVREDIEKHWALLTGTREDQKNKIYTSSGKQIPPGHREYAEAITSGGGKEAKVENVPVVDFSQSQFKWEFSENPYVFGFYVHAFDKNGKANGFVLKR